MRIEDFLINEQPPEPEEIVKEKDNPFDFVNSINYTKRDLIAESNNPEQEEQRYKPFYINRALSYFSDTIGYANLMNQYHHLDKKLQYDFYKYIVAPKKRFSKWAKPEKVGDIDIVKRAYGYSQKKAEIALSLLTPEQIKQLRKRQEQGGLKK